MYVGISKLRREGMPSDEESHLLGLFFFAISTLHDEVWDDSGKLARTVVLSEDFIEKVRSM